MSGEIARRPANVLASADVMGEAQFDNVFRMAKALAASGLFKDVTQAEQAFGRILLGRDLGLTPTQALMSVDVVKGNVQVRSVRLAAWVRQHPDYDYAITEHDDTHCVIEFFYRGESAGTSSYTMAEADAAGLTKPTRNGEPSNYKRHPRNMLFARAMSNGVKWFAPDLTGGIPVYTEADSFDVEGTATEIGRGEGDGSEPGWQGLTPDQIVLVEGVIAGADEVGYVPLWSGARAALQMKLSGQDTDTINNLIMDWQDELERFKAES